MITWKSEPKHKIIIILIAVLVSGCAGPKERQPDVIQPIWTKIFDRTTSLDFANQTADGGYITISNIESLQPSTEGVYQSYGWLIKTDKNGNEQWNKTFGGPEDRNIGSSVEQTSDGGYIIAGYTYTGSIYRTSDDAWLIKTDKNGNVQWNRTFGGSSNSAQRTSDEGYIIAVSGADSSVRNRIIKTDPNGNIILDKMLKGPDQTDINSIRQVSDGGYVIAGVTTSYGIEPESFNRRALLLKIININEA